jgi:anthranilate synthase component 1
MKRSVVYREFPLESITPAQAYQALSGENATLIELSEDKPCSYLGVDPIAIFKSKNRRTELITKGQTKLLSGDPYEELRAFIKAISVQSKVPLYADGLFGFVSYDAVRLVEDLPDNLPDLDQVPDLYFVLYGTVLIFNQKTLCIAKSVENASDAIQEIEAIRKKISQPFHFTLPTKEKEITLQMEMENEEYRDKVLLIKESIRKGEVFQLVISRAFSTPVKATPFQIYCTLSQINPSPYMFLLDTGGFAIIGASPEKLVSLKDGYIETCPVGGTYPKEKGEKALLADPKERAEHIMKMEVGRNDLSALSEPNSVEILELMGTRTFSHVIHIATRIRGRLRKDRDIIDVLKTMLPAAPISGSPKVRALELIETVEKSRRGFYSGVVCLLDARGNLTTCLTIRSLLLKEGVAKARAGATIVAYSDPQYEFLESQHKASAPIKALKLIEGSHDSDR